MAERVKEYISEERVKARIAQMGARISEEYAGESVHLIGILKGSIMFLAELAKHITIPVTMDFMSCSSYGSGTVSKGLVKFTKDLDEPIEGRHVIVVEDIIDTGNTLAYLTEQLKLRKPKTLTLCTLLDKPSRRVKQNIQVDHTCFEIDDYFVVGFGLDYDQRYRNLPYIGIIEFDED